MERLRDVLNGTWAGNYTYNSNPAFRPETRMEITSQISPNTGNLEVNGSGRDGFGAYTLKGSAKSPTEISCVKSFGWMNEWWHTATVDIDGRQMNGKWGPALAPKQVNGTFSFRRQITEADRQREEAAAQKQAEEARKREEEASAAAARQKQQEEEAARKKQEEEEQEAARKQKEEAEAAKKKAEEAETARKKQEQEQEAAKEQNVAEQARQQAADAEKEQKEAEDKQKEAERNQSMQEAARPRPQDTAPATKQKGKPIISPKDSEDGVAGNSKVYLRVDLDADIRVIAALKGDVAIGIL